jgi:hypothetical protein
VGVLVSVGRAWLAGAGSCDETSYFDSVEAEVEEIFERITGEPSAAARA